MTRNRREVNSVGIDGQIGGQTPDEVLIGAGIFRNIWGEGVSF